MACRRWFAFLGAVAFCTAMLMVISAPFADGLERRKEKVDQKPRLVVLVVFDQMRGDYLTKWQHLFDKDGFGRFLKNGAWFQNCHYPYANTMTAAGHTSMVTGCSPNKHGIIANGWYDRELAANINSVHTVRYPLVPSLGKKKTGAAPTRRKVKTVGDALIDQTKLKGKVVSISIKDRAAILMAALRRALALWFSGGNWVTSTYYRDNLPSWVSDYNKSRQVDKWFGKEWKHLRPDLTYGFLSGPDDFAYEGTGYKQGQTFPHPTTGGLKKVGPAYYGALANSPFGNEMTLDMAKRAIEHEQLGQDNQPDLLCVSFSSNDLVGHCWGPDSQEVLDITLRSDLLMKNLLSYLDRKVGKDKYVVVVCADHGVCPLPEVRHAEGHKKAGRVSPVLLKSKAEEFLSRKFARGEKRKWIESTSSGMIYLNRGVLQAEKLQQSTVENALAKWLTKQKGIRAAYTRSQLMAGKIGKQDKLGRMVQKSFHPDCSGDVMPVLEPYYLLSPPLSPNKTGAYTTTHGGPHPYDTHVPLLVYGPSVRAGIHRERVTPQAIAAIIARSVRIQTPQTAEAPVPDRLCK